MGYSFAISNVIAGEVAIYFIQHGLTGFLLPADHLQKLMRLPLDTFTLLGHILQVVHLVLQQFDVEFLPEACPLGRLSVLFELEGVLVD
jgi:hypothetical protein